MNILVWLIPIFPALAVLLNGLFGRRAMRSDEAYRERLPRLLGVGSVACALVCALIVILRVIMNPSEPIKAKLYTWIFAGAFTADMALQVDALSAVMLFVVCGVGFLVHVYSIGYMHGDPSYHRFFTYLNLFMTSMLILVLADNYLLMFVGWEGVGLCSYLLIGYWYDRQSASDAGKKAFIVNRIGDAGFILALTLIFWTTGSLNYDEVFARAAEGAGTMKLGMAKAWTATSQSRQRPSRVARGRPYFRNRSLTGRSRHHQGLHLVMGAGPLHAFQQEAGGDAGGAEINLIAFHQVVQSVPALKA